MPPTQVTIPLGGVDASGRPLPPTTTFLTGEGGTGLGNWEPYNPPVLKGEDASQAPQEGAGGALGNWEPYKAPEQPPTPEAPRQVGAGEAFVGGLAHGASFGAAPAIAGLSAASGMPLPQETEAGALDQPAGMALVRPFVGAYKLLTEGVERVKAYNEARDKALKDYAEAQKQHPYITGAGSLVGGLAVTPALGPLGSLRAASVLGRVAQGVKVGGVTGGLTGAGEATSKGESPADVAKEAGTGAAVGGILGGVLGGAIETGSGIARTVGAAARGHRDPELEAARQVADAARRGQPAQERLVRDPLALQVGQQADTPVFNVDVMGAPGRRLLRRATNLSPEAQDIAAEAIFPRFAGQGERAGDWFLSRFGGGDVGATLQNLQRAAAAANRPNYQRAQAMADRRFPQGIWSQASTRPGGRSLEELLGTPAVQRAMQTAIEKGGNASVLEGLGAFNPRVTFENGMLRFNGRGGVQAFPDMQLWDYTQRALRDMALEAPRGSNDARVLNGLQRELLAELDHLVPEFGHARGVAAQFFGANNALQAGEEFVTANQINGRKLRDPDVARLVRAMNPAERALFQYGFVTELVRKLGQVGDSRNVINQIANTRNARQRIATAMGPGALEETLALVRIESLVDRARTAAFGNSTSAQQLGDIVGGAAVGSSGFSPSAIVTGALLFAARQMHQTVDEQVMANVARMLVSEDPAAYARGVAIAARNPVIRETLRRVSDLSTRELISTVGPYGAAAGLATAASRVSGYGKPAAEPQHHYYEEDPQRGVSSFQQGH